MTLALRTWRWIDMTTTDTKPDIGVMYFDRSTYPKTAHTEGQFTLDGRVWTGEGYKEMRVW
jgi:hypothetical protein